MNSSEFVQRLKEIAPSEEKLRTIETDEKFIEEYLNSYNLKKIKGDTVTNDPLLDLIYKYDVSSFDISMIVLNEDDDVLDTDQYIIFGNEDSATMAIDKVTNEVVVLDSEEPDYIISKCSKDTASFLESLLLVEEFNQQMFFDEGLAEDQSAIRNKAKEIAEVAGGERYLSFYLEILGYEGE